jgi:ABC-type glycerol-3-phosphate transport system substrate-binding protein
VSTPPKFKVGTMLFPAVNGGAGTGKEVTLAQEALIFAKNDDPAVVKAFMEFFTRPDIAGAFTAGRAVIPTYKTKGGTVAPVIANQYKTVKGYVANAGANGSALFNDQGIAVDIYSKYIWQGSVGLMTGDVTPEKLAQQLEDATVAAQAANK